MSVSWASQAHPLHHERVCSTGDRIRPFHPGHNAGFATIFISVALGCGGNEVSRAEPDNAVLKADLADTEIFPAREGLIPQVSEDWRLANRQVAPDRFIAEFVPPGQTVHDWREMVTYQGFPRQDASAFLDSFESLARPACDGFAWHELRKSRQDGYAVHNAIMFAGLTDELGSAK